MAFLEEIDLKDNYYILFSKTFNICYGITENCHEDFGISPDLMFGNLINDN